MRLIRSRRLSPFRGADFSRLAKRRRDESCGARRSKDGSRGKDRAAGFHRCPLSPRNGRRHAPSHGRLRPTFYFRHSGGAARARHQDAGWRMGPGFKYDDTKTEDGRPLSIADLDSAVPDHPVHIEHRGGHTVYANSIAFRRAGIDEKTADPPGGKIDHDLATGKLSGRVAESAKDFFEKVIPPEFHTRRSSRGCEAYLQDARQDRNHFRNRSAGHS